MNIAILYFFAVLFGVISMGFKTGKKVNPKPNVIIILTDDQGYNDVGCYGAANIKTPNLDRMADEGVRMTNFYSASAVCTASRAGLLTGCYPNRLGISWAFMPGSDVGLSIPETTIADMLKKNGYKTAIFGKWHLGDNPGFMPNIQGFDEYFGIPYSNDMWPFHPQQGTWCNFGPLPLYENSTIIDTLTDQTHLTTLLTEKSVEFIKENKNKPFFMYLAHPQPHVPLFVSDKFKGKSKRGLYGDVIMEIDWSVGQILDALKRNNIDENTIVIFTSDNGPWLCYGDHAGSAYPLREGKGTVFEGGQKEPCIIRYPQKIKAGSTIHTPVMSIDILPTIAEITGSVLPAMKIDGKNVWDVWSGNSSEGPQKAYFFYYNDNQLYAVRYKNWKMYFPHKFPSLNGKPGGKNGLPARYETNTITKTELYNLSEDESETTNVADENQDVVILIDSLANMMREELGDNFLNIKGKGNRSIGKVK